MYDTVNAYAEGTQPSFYSSLAAEVGATSILDLGCGTGLITCALAAEGYRVIGVDPARGMLDEARRRPSGKAVTWIVGDASRLGAPEVDLAIMSGHVVQFFLSDEDWSDALHALHDSLRPGGRLSFESRNPRAFEWETWTRDTRRILDDPRAGRLETWSEVHDMQDDIVSYTNHYAFLATGDELVSAGQLRFRTRPQLISSLAAAGFVVEQMYGDWDRTPAGPTSRELIVVAAR